MKISDIPLTPTNLKSLLDPDNPYCQAVILQAHETNAANIFFGPVGEAEIFIGPGKSSTFPINTLSALEIYATQADEGVTIILVRI